jgi:UDP-N-acetylglucosamine 2-epimerase (non-hydrolysing)
MPRLLFIFGTRPEFIKLYPVIREARRRGHDTVVANTGQHKEMVNQLLTDFDEMVHHDLGVMDDTEGLAQILARSIERLDDVVRETAPDLIFVHGDTSATLAGSIVALYHQVPLAHVEAGLRTHNKFSPFPEEMNRQLTAVLADYHFAPTELARDHLLREGRPADRVWVVGNSAIDMLKYTVQDEYTHPVLDELGERDLILITVHRRENLGRLDEIFTALNEIALRYRDTHELLYPIHLNPLIRAHADRLLTADNLKIIEPLDTIDFHNVMSRAKLVLTDSGGIQEEAPSLGKPVLVLRDTTERPEGVEAGTLRLVGTCRKDIIRETVRLIEDEAAYRAMAGVVNPYGDGTTAQQILDVIDGWEFVEGHPPR